MLRELCKQVPSNQEEELQKLLDSIALLEKEANRLFAELGIEGEEIDQFLRNKEHFTPLQWKRVEEHLEEIDELKKRHAARSTEALKKNYEERSGVGQHWLFVK